MRNFQMKANSDITVSCKVCRSKSSYFGEAEVMGAYQAAYFRCESCGFIQVNAPDWLEAAYERAITNSDVGLVSRNVKTAGKTKDLILACLNPRGRFVDYGGGYGLFTRLMRDQGFEFFRLEPNCENIFASGFDADYGSEYDLLTSWEVFEHFEDPIPEFERLASLSRNIFFSTLLVGDKPAPLGEWWYYGLEHGQHLSFYTTEALNSLANRFDRKLHFSNGFLHFIGDPSISSLRVKLALDRRFRWIVRFIKQKAPPSLTKADFIKTGGLPQ